jgi:CheY-like chemotaxis protein
MTPDELWFALRESESRERRLKSELDALRRDVREREADNEAFLEALSQDLREPLSALGSAAQVVLQTAGHDEQCRWAVGLLERQLQRMTRVADVLLDLSHLAQGKLPLKLECLDLEPALNAAIATLEGELQLRDQRLTVQSPLAQVPVWGDRTRLIQVLSVLLDDAARHGSLGTTIPISVTAEAGEVVVRIPAGEARTNDEGLPRGSSFGMTLVRQLLELHGGTVAATVGPASGDGEQECEVVLRLPTPSVPSSSTRAPEVPGSVPPAAGRRILVVDDHRDTAEALARVLEARGHQALAVHSGQSALDALESFRPHAVLLDLGLPVMDGLEVARRIRARPELRDLILVAATGHGEQEDRRRSLQAGFDHHLVKPIRPELIEALLVPSGPAPVAADSNPT